MQQTSCTQPDAWIRQISLARLLLRLSEDSTSLSRNSSRSAKATATIARTPTLRVARQEGERERERARERERERERRPVGLSGDKRRQVPPEESGSEPFTVRTDSPVLLVVSASLQVGVATPALAVNRLRGAYTYKRCELQTPRLLAKGR